MTFGSDAASFEVNAGVAPSACTPTDFQYRISIPLICEVRFESLNCRGTPCFDRLAPAHTIAYRIDRTIPMSTPNTGSVGPGTVTGTIATDGTIGDISNPNIVSFPLAIQAAQLDGRPNATLEQPVDSIGTRFQGYRINGMIDDPERSALTATATELIFDFSRNGAFFGFVSTRGRGVISASSTV